MTAPTITKPTPPALRTADAAAYLGMTVRALLAHRDRGTGPISTRRGKLIYFPIAELDRWMLGDYAESAQSA